MSTVNFEEIKTNFINADVDGKIKIYIRKLYLKVVILSIQ